MTNTNIQNLSNLVKQLYKSGHALKVKFTKADGSVREMAIERNPLIESREVKGVREHPSNVLPVIERLADGGHQWRSIRLDRLISAKEI